MNGTPRYTVSSGNDFAAPGVPEPEMALRKADLTRAIIAAIEARGLTPTEAGELLGIVRPKVSAIDRGRLREFSVGRLTEFLTLLGLDIDIGIAPSKEPDRTDGRISVHAAP